MQETWDAGSILGLGRCPGGEHSNPLQFSCLENPMKRGAWWVTVHGFTQSQTWLKWLSTHSTHTSLGYPRPGTMRFLLPALGGHKWINTVYCLWGALLSLWESPWTGVWRLRMFVLSLINDLQTLNPGCISSSVKLLACLHWADRSMPV